MRHLDTNVISALMQEVRNAEILLTRHYPRVAISAITLAEMRFGIANSSRHAKNMAKLRAILKLLDVIPFDEKCGVHYGVIRKSLHDKGRNVPDADLFIAATALAHNAVLVTHNKKDFEHIDGLQLEDWIA